MFLRWLRFTVMLIGTGMTVGGALMVDDGAKLGVSRFVIDGLMFAFCGALVAFFAALKGDQ